MQEKLQAFAEVLEQHHIEDLKRRDLACQANLNQCKVSIKPGKKYTKIDVGSSGKYMVDGDGNIFGIKGYGQINKKKHYGTLDTLTDWYWGRYYAVKIIPEEA